MPTLWDAITGITNAALLIFAVRLAYSLGQLSQNVTNISDTISKEQKFIRHLMEEGDRTRERVAVVESKVEALEGGR